MDESKREIPPDRRMFGEWLRAARHAVSLSQAQLARVARISPVYVSQIETGQRIPADRNARLIAEALGLAWKDVLRATYSLRSQEAGELFSSAESGRSDSAWKSISDIPAVRQLLLELAGLNLSKQDVQKLARNWNNDLRLISALTKAQGT